MSDYDYVYSLSPDDYIKILKRCVIHYHSRILKGEIDDDLPITSCGECLKFIDDFYKKGNVNL